MTWQTALAPTLLAILSILLVIVTFLATRAGSDVRSDSNRSAGASHKKRNGVSNAKTRVDSERTQHVERRRRSRVSSRASRGPGAFSIRRARSSQQRELSLMPWLRYNARRSTTK